MKKFYVTLSLALAVAMTASAATKFDASSLSAVNFYKKMKAEPGAQHAVPVQLPFDMTEAARGGQAEASVIIMLAPGMTASDIEAAGLEVSTMIGDDMCLANGSMDDIIALENNDAVKSVSISAPLRTLLDKARDKSGVDKVHSGTSLSKTYTGKGVVVGLHDSGVDPNHINFYNKDFTESRVRAVYNFIGTSTTPIEYTAPDRIAAFTTDSRKDTHGTHTLGCMTGAFNRKGNGSDSNKYPTGQAAIFTASGSVTSLASTACPYYGTAPDADIVVNCGALTNAATIAAVQNIVNYANANNKPCVVSLSLGGNSGSHDGLDNFGQAMSRLSKDAIICVSSGNEGDANISIIKNLTSADPYLRTCLNFTGSTTGVLDIYGSDKNPFTLGIAVIEKATGKILYQKDFDSEGEFTVSTSNFTTSGHLHDSNFDKAFTGSYVMSVISDNKATSGRRGINISYSLKTNTTSNSGSALGLAIICKGNPGQRIDIVNSVVSGSNSLASNNLSGFSAGSPDLTINNLACSSDVIAVGAWTTRTTWPTIGKGTFWFGENSPIIEDRVSPFTSYGVLYDGRELPDICAPGAGIVSSISSYYTDENNPGNTCTASYTYKGRTYTWNSESGTSMASPFCAGVIATWLEADPSLTVARVKEIMTKTADPLTGPDVKTGPGRLNAYEGLKMVLNNASVNSVSVDNQIIVSSNGANMFEVFVPGGNVNVAVYNLNGQIVKSASAADNTLGLNLNSLSKGIYLLNVNGVETQRIAIN